MQFIAEDPIHVVCSNEEPALHDTNGRLVKPGKRRTYAKFSRGTAPEFARVVGLRTFELRKMPEGVAPEQWLAYYDSVEAQAQHNWTDQERKAIEERLQSIDGVILVEKPRLPAPWPKYDEIVASKEGLSSKEVVDKIVGTIESIGCDPAVVIAYEQQRDKPRKSVISAVEALLPADATPAPDENGWLDEELIEA